MKTTTMMMIMTIMRRKKTRTEKKKRKRCCSFASDPSRTHTFNIPEIVMHIVHGSPRIHICSCTRLVGFSSTVYFCYLVWSADGKDWLAS